MKPENPFEYLVRGLEWAVASSGLSLDDIAERTGITSSYLRTLLTGCVNPRQAVLVDLAEVLGRKVSEIYAHGESVFEAAGRWLLLCSANPGSNEDLISFAALAVSAKRSRHSRSLYLCLNQPEEWLREQREPFDMLLEDRFGPSYITSSALPGLGSPGSFGRMAGLIEELRPDVVVVDNLARLHPDTRVAADPKIAQPLDWYRAADREALRQLRQSFEGFHPLEVLVIHYVEYDDARNLEREGLVDAVVSIEQALLGPADWQRFTKVQR